MNILYIKGEKIMDESADRIELCSGSDPCEVEPVLHDTTQKFALTLKILRVVFIYESIEASSHVSKLIGACIT